MDLYKENDQNAGGQGFLAMEYPFDKENVIQILKDMGVEYTCDSDNCIEYYVTEDPEDFLTRYRNTTYQKGTFSRAEINESGNKITFISKWGYLIRWPNELMFSIGSKMFKFKSDSDRYSIYFIPASYKSETFRKYGGTLD